MRGPIRRFGRPSTGFHGATPKRTYSVDVEFECGEGRPAQKHGPGRESMASVTGANAESIHRDNLGALVYRVHAGGARSRSDLVAETGLSRSAVRSLVNELVTLGLVYESAPAPAGSPGRPSPLVRPKPDGAVVLAMDIEVDSLAIATVGLGGQIFDHVRIDRPRDRFSPEDTVADLADLAADALSRRPASERLVGIGVAVVGIVRSADGLVHLAPNLDWHEVPLAQIIRDRLRTSLPIRVGNEADLAALAEHVRGAGVGVDDLLYVSGEVGIGGGAIVGGRPLVGYLGYGGEIGHMVVNPLGLPCRCGSQGCWETEIGEAAILRWAGVHEADGGRAAVESVLQRAADGDATALRALDSVGRWLALGIANLANFLNPEVVVLGGLLARVHPFVADAVQAEVERRALPVVSRSLRIVRSGLGTEGSLLGAAEAAFVPGLADPSLLQPALAGPATGPGAGQS